MGEELRRRLRSVAGFGMQSFYEELPLGPHIMVSHPARVWCPPTDVFECDRSFVIKIALSGLQRAPDGKLQDMEVFVKEDTIIVRGERKDHCSHNRCRYFQMEIYYGPFECRVRFGSPFDSEAIEASYSDGFLEIIVPKASPESRKARQIKVRP